MKRMREVWLLLMLSLAGCGNAKDRWKDARPATTPASGRVTYRGEPLEGAIVVFQPRVADGIGASALTDSEGKFDLKTFPPESGIVPGSYSVMIIKSEMPKGPAGAENKENAKEVFAVSVIPVKYSDAAKSGLSAEVPLAGTDQFVFELKD